MGPSISYLDNPLKVFGYCEENQEIIKHHIYSRDFKTLQNMKGEFTLVHTSNGETIIITSLIGAMQYFYYYNGITFSHGERIVDIINEQNLGWDWDWESLGDLCELENLTQDRTLHKDIKKVPPGTLLIFQNKLKLYSVNLLDQMKVIDANPVDAIDVFNQETSRWVGGNPILSLSGGFDSRVILSSMLRQGIYPTIVTLGNKENSDMQVAKMIAKKFCLDHIQVKLSLDDLLNCGERISYITNGSKPACHWHTYIYPRKAGISKENSFFVGTLGEFARSYYFDKGFISLLNDSFSSFAQERFWILKLSRHRTFQQQESSYLCDHLCEEISDTGIKRRAHRNALLSRGDFLSGGCRYYLEQRIPNFYANGITMYNDSSSWRSPFHNLKWLEIIWSLCDHWKLGSNWHRLAISRNYPSLLDFPEEKGFNKIRMLKKAPPFYWLPIMQRLKYKSYDLSTMWYIDKRIQEFILDHSPLLDELIDRRLIESIIHEHVLSKNRTRAISFLLTIIYFRLSLSRGGK